MINKAYNVLKLIANYNKCLRIVSAGSIERKKNQKSKYVIKYINLKSYKYRCGFKDIFIL